MPAKERVLTNQEYIDQYCGGDVRKFRASIITGRKETISWDDLNTSSRLLTDYTQRARQLIEQHLGYLPAPAVYLPHEVFIRALAEANECQNYSQKQFADALLTHIRHIRNDDIHKNGLTDNLPLSQRDIERYHSYLSEYKKQVRDRVTTFFGQEQSLDYALHAELQLREAFAQRGHEGHTELTAADYRTFTIIAYLRLYHEQGQQTADASRPPASADVKKI